MKDRWAIGWVKGDWPELQQGRKAPNWLHPPPGHFYADPFVVTRDGTPWVFFEDYVGASERGHIACCANFEGPVVPVLEADFHLSYPFLLEWEGQLFCVPEQNASGKLSLYRCLDFPGKWVEECELLSDCQVIDPTLLHWQNHWYLWVGEVGESARHEVLLYQSESLTGPWKPHARVPRVKWDWTGRNGGTILSYQGRLLRPAQNRTRTYGGSLVLYEISELSPHGYREHEWGRWEPDPGWPYPDGLHHLCARDGYAVIDAKLIVEDL